MKDEFLALFGSAKALVTYIDEEYVFDKASAGGCSGIDYHLSDAFYDLITNTKKAISDAANGLNATDTDSEDKRQEDCVKLFETVSALTTHIDKEHAFDKTRDMGPVGIETYQSDAFIEVIQQTKQAVAAVKGVL
jgi:hypothetical protein